MSVELPYGFRVHYEARVNGRLVQKWFRSRSPRAHAQMCAQFKQGFIRVIRLEPFTREEWIRVFGKSSKHLSTVVILLAFALFGGCHRPRPHEERLVLTVESSLEPLQVLCDDNGKFIHTDETGHPIHAAWDSYESAAKALAHYKAKDYKSEAGHLTVCTGPTPSPSPTPIEGNKIITIPAWIKEIRRSAGQGQLTFTADREIGIYIEAHDGAPITDVPILQITLSCGSHWELCPGDTIPSVDVPCYCGNPKHFFFKVSNSTK